jgi:4'-phosphopantetheinyl transferase
MSARKVNPVLRADGTGRDCLRSLKEGQAIVAVAVPGETTDAEALIMREQLLTGEERESVERLMGFEQQHDRVVARSLVRLGLSHAFPVPPQDWIFSTTEHQKPLVVAPQGWPPVHFSLSHTRGLVALLVTQAANGGVDVERMELTNDLPLVALKICAASELEAINRFSGDAWKERFFELWTLKEAYAKARGLGHSLRWREIAFEIDAHHNVTVQFAPEIGDDPKGWQFWLRRLSPEYMLAAAVRDGSGFTSFELTLQSVRIRATEQNTWLEPLDESTTTTGQLKLTR